MARETLIPSWEWTPKRSQAAGLVAADMHSNQRIADLCEIDVRTLQNWKLVPEFIEEVTMLRKGIATEMKDIPIANKINRLKAINRRHNKFEDIIASREAEYAVSDASEADGVDNDDCDDEAVAARPKKIAHPGMYTGLLVERRTVVRTKDGETVTIDAVADAFINKEMSSLEKQAADEAGDYVQRVQAIGADGKPVGSLDTGALSDEELDVYEQLLAKMTAPRTRE